MKFPQPYREDHGPGSHCKEGHGRVRRGTPVPIEAPAVWAGVLAVAVWSLSGCTTAPPHRVEVKSVPVQSAWAATNALAGPVEGDWWRHLADTNLLAAIEEALANNHDLRAALARLDAAAAQSRIAWANRWPGVDFNFDASKREQKFVGFPIPGARSDVLASRSQQFTATFSTSWELDLWGRVRAGQQAALAELQASQSDVRAARLSLVAQVVKAWLAVAEAQRQLALAQSTAENYQLTAERVRRRYEQGLRSPLDLRLALTSASSAQALVVQRRVQLEAAVRQLQLLLGRYPSGQWPQTKALPAFAEEVPAGLPSELLERRPDLQAAERRLAAARVRVKEAKAALFPRIALTATGGRTSSQLEDLISDKFTIWTLAGNLAQPLFQWGRLRAGVKLAQARAREALEAYAGAMLRAFQEVESALADEVHLRQREADLAEATRQARAAMALAEDRYRMGLEEFVTLLEAQRRALDSESQWLAVRRERLDNRVDLYLALGGGFNTPGALGESAGNTVPPLKTAAVVSTPAGTRSNPSRTERVAQANRFGRER